MEFLQGGLYFIVKLVSVTFLVCQAGEIFKEQMKNKVCAIFGYRIKVMNLYYFFFAVICSILFDQIVACL